MTMPKDELFRLAHNCGLIVNKFDIPQPTSMRNNFKFDG